MTKQDLKNKMMEWLDLKKKADDLEKAKLSLPLGPGMGTISGIDIGGDSDKDKKRSSVGIISAAPVTSTALGKIQKKPINPKDPAMNTAQFPPKAKTEEQQKEYHARIIQYIKNHKFRKTLTASEEKGVHQRSVIPNRTTPHMESHNSSSMGDDVRSSHVLPRTGSVHNYGTKAIGNARSSAAHTLKELKQMPKPNLPKSENMQKTDEDIVAGIKVPNQLKEHKGPVPHDHPHREIAAKFVSDVWKKHKPSGQRMSERYLGVSDEQHPKYSSTTERYATIKSDKIPGGLADNKIPSDFNQKQLSAGKNIEREHTNDPKIAQEIAMDHLVEDPRYYNKLKTIESNKSEVKPIPAGVSEPIIENKISLQNPKQIDNPNVINSYKSENCSASMKVLNFLRNKRG